MSDVITIYCTFPTKEYAEQITRSLLDRRLVACANIMAAGQSMYWWRGEIQNEPEVYVLFKTVREQFEAVRAAIAEMHPYQIPCIVALPIEAGHQPYLDWVKVEVKPA